MAQVSKLEELRLRKQLLLAESDLNRARLAQDMARLAPSAAWVDRGYSVCQSMAPGFRLLTPIANTLLGRKSPGRLLATALFVARFVPGVWKLWRDRRQPAGVQPPGCPATLHERADMEPPGDGPDLDTNGKV